MILLTQTKSFLIRVFVVTLLVPLVVSYAMIALCAKALTMTGELLRSSIKILAALSDILLESGS